MARVRIEFTVEPFVEAHPGPHVTAAIDAVERWGLVAEVGPFSTVTDAPGDTAAAVVSDLVQAALDHGATRIALQVERSGDDAG